MGEEDDEDVAAIDAEVDAIACQIADLEARREKLLARKKAVLRAKDHKEAERIRNQDWERKGAAQHSSLLAKSH